MFVVFQASKFLTTALVRTLTVAKVVCVASCRDLMAKWWMVMCDAAFKTVAFTEEALMRLRKELETDIPVELSQTESLTSTDELRAIPNAMAAPYTTKASRN